MMNSKEQIYWLWIATNESCGARFAVIARTKQEAIEAFSDAYPALVAECAGCNEPEIDRIENLPWQPWSLAISRKPEVVAISLGECADGHYKFPEH